MNFVHDPETFVIGNNSIKRCNIHSDCSGQGNLSHEKFQVRDGCPSCKMVKF